MTTLFPRQCGCIPVCEGAEVELCWKKPWQWHQARPLGPRPLRALHVNLNMCGQTKDAWAWHLWPSDVPVLQDQVGRRAQSTRKRSFSAAALPGTGRQPCYGFGSSARDKARLGKAQGSTQKATKRRTSEVRKHPRSSDPIRFPGPPLLPPRSLPKKGI